MPVPASCPRNASGGYVDASSAQLRPPTVWTPLEVGPALRGPLLALNAPLVPGGAAHVSPADGRVLLVAQNAIHILTPSVSFHPLFNPTGEPVLHTQIPREAPNLDDWKDRPFYLDQMLVPSHTFWTRTWLDARWAPDLSYLASGAPLVAALSNEYMVSVFEPEADAQTSNWTCRQLLEVPSDGDEVLAELDSQLTCLDWLATLAPGKREDCDWTRPLVTGARSGRVSAWVWAYETGKLVPFTHIRLAEEPIMHIALETSEHGVVIAATTASRLYIHLLGPDGEWSAYATHPVNNPQAIAFGRSRDCVAVMSTGKVDIVRFAICTGGPQHGEDHGLPARPWPQILGTWSYILDPLQPQLQAQARAQPDTSATPGDAEDQGEEDELVAQVQTRPLSPFSPLAALQPFPSGGWSVVLTNGATYVVPAVDPNKPYHSTQDTPSGGNPGEDLPAQGALIVEARKGKSIDKQRLALAKLQDVTACLLLFSGSKAAASSPEPDAMQSAFALAARSDDVVAPLQFRGIHARVQVSFAVLAPYLTEEELVEQALACVVQQSWNPSDLAFFVHAFSLASPGDRAGVSQRILDLLGRAHGGTTTNARAALWLASWLKAREPEPQRADGRYYADSFRTEIERRIHFAITASDPHFLARQRKAYALLSGVPNAIVASDLLSQAGQREGDALASDSKGEAGPTSCPACEHDVPFALGTRTRETDSVVTPLLTGVCQGGHTWRRCSITFRLLVGAHARRCGTCLVHALLPSDPDVSPVEAEVLRGATSCTLCGGMWMVQ